MVVPKGFFGNGDEVSRVMFEVVRYHHILGGLGGNAPAGTVSVFERLGLTGVEGMRIRSHQFRHWLNTLAQGAGLSQVDIAKWSGRNSIAQNQAYNHVTGNQILEKMRLAVGDEKRAIGAIAKLPAKLPMSREEFSRLRIPTAHATEYGFCVHDFATAPCEMFRRCLDCREHVCVKGVPGSLGKR